jgi:hypothetical protein
MPEKYEKKGFLDADITYRTEEIGTGEAAYILVNENEKIRPRDHFEAISI